MGRGAKETLQRFPLVAAKKRHNTWEFFTFFSTLLDSMIFEGFLNKNVTFHIFERMLLICTNFFEKAGD